MSAQSVVDLRELKNDVIGRDRQALLSRFVGGPLAILITNKFKLLLITLFKQILK
jgi:hypothetical protein